MTPREVEEMTIADLQEMAESVRVATGAPKVEIVIGDDENSMRFIAKADTPPPLMKEAE
jgi:hypothetical protein